MQKLIDQLSQCVAAAFEAAGYDPAAGKVTLSNRPDLCEFQCNGAMPAAKSAHKAPILIANEVVAQLKGSDLFSSCEAVAPGFIETDVTAALPEAVRAEMAKGIPAGRAGQPEDVAQAVAFFAAEQSSYLTGQVLCVDGGMAM